MLRARLGIESGLALGLGVGLGCILFLGRS